MVATVDLRHDEIRLFSKFAHLYDAGVPLAEALELVRRELGEVLHEAVGQIVEDLYRGTSLADALGRRTDLFSGEIVGVIRAGEARGELGNAGRSVADGLMGKVLDPAVATQADLESLLEQMGDAPIMHLDPSGMLRLRSSGQLGRGREADVARMIAALARRARIQTPTGRGGFLWNDRLVRVAVAQTAEGPAAVVRVSGPPRPVPDNVHAWRRGPPRLLLVEVPDPDSRLRAILGLFDGKRVAVNLPVPEAICVESLEVAQWLDPDVIAVAELRSSEQARRLAEAAVHTVASVGNAAEIVKTMGAGLLRPPEIAVS